MFGAMKQKELILIFSVVGFGSVALVALGELSSVAPGSPLFKFYLNLVFGGLAVFYAVFIHFATLSFTRKLDQKKKARFRKLIFGEKSSFIFVLVILGGVLVFWIYTFANLTSGLNLKYF